MLSSNKKRFLKFWFPVILYSAIIFYVSSLPNLEIPLDIAFSDKLVHAVEYAILGFLVSRALAATTQLSRERILFGAAVFCILYGISDEFHQVFVPGRNPSLSDVLTDGIGAWLGGFLFRLRRQRTLG